MSTSTTCEVSMHDNANTTSTFQGPFFRLFSRPSSEKNCLHGKTEPALCIVISTFPGGAAGYSPLIRTAMPYIPLKGSRVEKVYREIWLQGVKYIFCRIPSVVIAAARKGSWLAKPVPRPIFHHAQYHILLPLLSLQPTLAAFSWPFFQKKNLPYFTGSRREQLHSSMLASQFCELKNQRN